MTLTAEEIAKQKQEVEAAEAEAKAKVEADAKAKADKEAKEAEERRKLLETSADKDAINKLLEEERERIRKETKEKLDNAYAARDEALKKAKELDEARKALEIQRLKESGKEKEALELELAAERAKNETLNKRNTELSRDVSVRAALSGVDFRNEFASEVASKEITANLIQDSSGNWIHKSGVSIAEAVANFVKDETKSFLLKPKTSSGGGSGEQNGKPNPNAGKSLFNMTQAEVIALAEKGQLGRK